MRNCILILMLLFFTVKAFGQAATIKENEETIKTYPFSDPNPVPTLAINDMVSRFYPYFMFDGYTRQSEKKDWNVVTLENPYIKVTVLPEVGGKVMGAIEKSTGQEFIYLNHVLKFRAVGIRGPWTSGGIEHNFGLDLGHAPWTAAQVDYVMKEYPDGSVSCIVGGLDLASRSRWSVDIHLPNNKAYFETKSLLYNPNPFYDAYLSWENAAYKATDDLEFFFPGTHHVGHGGSAHPWPVDEKGRNLALYRENNFGGHKSYHIVGNYRNWFGLYWHQSDFGSGHWAPYSDAPGKKIWIWSLARNGAIWENLLTDEDGQYIEAQSGVKFNQAAENSGFNSPFKQLFLRPFYSDTKTEYWFPVKNTNGMVDASPEGTLNVEVINDSLKISVSPNMDINDTLVVSLDNRVVYTEVLQLKPMQVFHKNIELQGEKTKGIKVRVGKNKLEYTSDKNENQIDRPVHCPDCLNDNSAERLFRLADDAYAMRKYEEALDLYKQCLTKEPTHSRALTRMADIRYRSGQFEEGISYARKVLEADAYDGGANFIYGVIHRELGQLTKAEEALSVAARIMEFRSAAYVELSGIQIQKHDFQKAIGYAQKALDYNRNNLIAHELLGTAYRKINNIEKADNTFAGLLNMDPLNHYARFEQYLLQPTSENLHNFKSAISNELAYETYLELALQYVKHKLTDEAIQILEQSPPYPTVYYWLAYLKKDSSPPESREYLKQAEEISPAFVFPFRLESIPVLEWAKNKSSSWKTTYYLGLIYWSKLQTEKAKNLFEECADTPDYAPFYLSRGILFQGDSAKNSFADRNFRKAVELDPNQWRTWHYLVKHLESNSAFPEQNKHAEQAYNRFPDNPVTGLDFATSLLNVHQYKKSLEVLEKVYVLPQEGAREGHDIFEMVNLALAVQNTEQKKYKEAIRYINNSKIWPENLGAGKPYNPDVRLQDYISAFCETRLGNPEQANHYYNQIMNYTLDPENMREMREPLNDYVGALVLKKQGKQQEATRLLNRWLDDKDTSDLQVQWIIASYLNEKEKVEKIEKELFDKGVQNRFRIFLRIIDNIKD